MIKLSAPNKISELGWYVAEDVEESFFADYLHPDGKVYPSMTGTEGKMNAGYFKTEVDAYKAIFNFYINKI